MGVITWKQWDKKCYPTGPVDSHSSMRKRVELLVKSRLQVWRERPLAIPEATLVLSAMQVQICAVVN